jgi:lambda family phage minor tail protein L
MPRATDPAFKSEKAKQANQPVYLYTVYDYDGVGTNLYFAEYDSNVTYGGIEYIKFPVSHEYISENAQGRIDTVKVTLANVSRLIQSYLEDYDLRGKKVSIKLVWANQLTDPDAYIEDVYYIDSYTADQMDVEFTLASKFDVLSVELPGRRYSRNYCYWKFKSAECGYIGIEASCNKTKIRCKELNNYQRFGAFPSVPTRRIYVM